MIEIKNVGISYGKNKIFEQFSLTIKDGDFLCIYGKSGSGKTTLLNLLGLLEKPDSGKIVSQFLFSNNRCSRSSFFGNKPKLHKNVRSKFRQFLLIS